MTNISEFAVFGHPIKHSKSPQIHQLFAQQTGRLVNYFAQDVSVDNFITQTQLFFENGGKGINCTVPLKEQAFLVANQLTARASLAKAVNTLKIQDDGSLLGDNTDGIGLVTDLVINNNINLLDIRILIMGAGGACRGIIGPILESKPKQLTIANRTLSKAEEIVSDFKECGELDCCVYSDLSNVQFDLVINATSASLTSDLPPIRGNLLANNASCYDLAYSQIPTAFVEWGLVNHASKSIDGLGMLIEQAAEAFLLWHGIRPETKEIFDLLNNQRQASSANINY